MASCSLEVHLACRHDFFFPGIFQFIVLNKSGLWEATEVQTVAKNGMIIMKRQSIPKSSWQDSDPHGIPSQFVPFYLLGGHSDLRRNDPSPC